MLENCVITESELIGRINRKLALDSETSRAARMTESPSFGNYYAVADPVVSGLRGNDLESLGRKLGLLFPHETLIEAELDG